MLAFAVAFAAGTAWAAERILDFDSFIVVHPDSTMTVTETIQVVAEGREIRRGIVREFPTLYRTPDGRRVRVDFTVEGVQRNGAPETFRVESEANGKAVYIGRREVMLPPGVHTYTIRYRTTRQLGFFGDFDELYWNVTGNGWIFPIFHARAEVALPPGATVLRHAAYTGPTGAAGSNFGVAPPRRGGAIAFETTLALNPQEGLTIAVAWPKGFVAAPSGRQELVYLLRDHAEDLAALALVMLLLGYFLWSWLRVGRDPPRGTIVPLFAPPKDMSPAATRYVRRMGFDSTAFAATVVNLAVRKRLRIEEASDGFRLRRLEPGPADLDRVEQAVLDKLPAGTGAILDLVQANHARIGPAQRALNDALAGAYQPSLFVVNFGRSVIGFVLSFIIVFVIIVLQPTPWILVPALAAIVLMNLLFLRLLKAPTPAGRKVMDEIEGFRMYLAAAEQSRLEVLHPPERTPELFERYLPYALALDVANEWAEQFADVLAAAAAAGKSYAPDWYVGSSRDPFRPDRLTSRLGGAFTRSIAASATPPGRSGSGSGSSGGGSSGGGGGGGGGRGW